MMPVKIARNDKRINHSFNKQNKANMPASAGQALGKCVSNLPQLESYVLTDLLGESLQALVYKGYHPRYPEQRLVIKQLKLLSSWEEQSLYLRQKIERLKVLHDPRACIPVALESEGANLFIVQPWFRGVPVEDWVNHREPVAKRISIPDFLDLACTLADILQAVHDAGITHGGIKPHNILMQPGTLITRLTDFITPLDIRDVSHFIYNPEFVRGTLAYTSPEQTGRINYRVDFSTDMYSLGIVFYELLTGRLPYFSSDPLELIHSHLAEDAIKVHETNPEVPPALGEIVAKLMTKQPEKRYQSAAGLFADLHRCREEYAATGSIPNFPVGRQDRTRRVIFISKMVGRQAESLLIRQCYDEVVGGNFRSVFISGFSGIGKTRLIQELQKPLVQHRGYFTSGKFDLYQKNIPYSSLIQAMRNLVRIFLTESDAQLLQWKTRILDALETSAQVIVDVVPELEFIIGPQPEVPHLPPVEARNRFNNLFSRFLNCLASSDNPLVLFIDDLQWCDAATFDFLHFIFANHSEYPYLFIVGAYRHNEVGKAHPLTKLIRNIHEQDGPMQEILLQPLSTDDCHAMVAYILDSSQEKTAHLAQFVANLTEGNPLFVSEILAWLYNENLLYTDGQHHWQWNMEKIRETQMPASVVELFSAKVCKLPADTLHILDRCACMGNRFTAQELMLILDTDLITLFERLKPVLSLGMLLENKSDLQFVHDKVQEAVLARLNERARPPIHWHIGNRLLSAVPMDADLERQDNLFTIAIHLNKGRPPEIDEQCAYQLARINFHAGNKALDALAAEAANEFFLVAYKGLPANSWDASYELTFRICQRLAKTELMCGRYEASETLLNLLIEHAVSDFDKAEALAEQTTSLSSFGNFIKAIETANRGLAYFNKAIPDNAEEAQQRMQALMEQIEARGNVWDKILHMPFTRERKRRIELAFYSELIPDLYMSGMVPQLYLAAAQSTMHCLEGGMDESVIYSFSIMGLNLGEQEQFELAFKYEDLAHNLCTKYPNTFGATRGINGIVWCNMHSRSHPEAIVEYARKGIECGKNCGDLYNAGLSYGPLMWNLIVQGKNLHAVEEAAEECLHFSRKNHLSFSVGLAEAVQAGWVAPMKPNYKPVEMEGTLARWAAENYVAASGSYFVLLGISQTYLGDDEKAAESLQNVNRYLHGLTDNVLKRLWYIFSMINKLRQTEAQTWPAINAEIAPLLHKVAAWAELGPLLKPYLAFLRAEIARASGDAREARTLYLDAIVEAQAQDYGLLAGHLYECIGEITANAGMGETGVWYAEARRIYRICRADGMIVRLQKLHEFSQEKAPLSENEKIAEMKEFSTLPSLDINYLMKSSLLISGEIDLDRLLSKIMKIVMESSGAQLGYLLIREDGVLTVVAGNHAGAKGDTRCQPYPLDGAHEICQPIVNYVFRTQSKVVLRNASAEGEFQNIREVQALGICSVLCLPIVTQARLVGVLYLENRLSEGIFTPEKVGMTELLTSHAAIALENARLVNDTRLSNIELQESRQILCEQSEALRKSTELVQAHINNTPMAFVAWDDSYHVTQWSGGAERMFGWSAEETLGKPIMNLHMVYEEDIPPVQKTMASLAEINVRDVVSHNRNVTKDGRVIDCVWYNTVLSKKDGTLGAIMSQVMDVTEQKRAERELCESEQRFKTLASATYEGVAITSHGRYVDVNEQMTQILGYAREELIGKPVMDLIAPEDRDWVMTNILANQESHVEHAAICKDGSCITVEARGRTVSNGDTSFRVTAIRDITDRKRIEQEMIALNIQLEHKIDARNIELAALTAHTLKIAEEERANLARELHDELGSALVGISMELGFLKRDISGACAGMDFSRIDELLSHSKQISKSVVNQLYPTILDNCGLVAAIEWLVNEFKKSSGIAVELSMPAETFGVEQPVALAVYRIAQECLTNIAKHADAGKAHVNLDFSGDFLDLSISDDGKGLPEMTNSGGLGMFGMTERARYLGGSMEIKSEKGKGAAVRLRLPLKPAKLKDKKSVLVVDDHAIVRDAIRQLLKTHGSEFSVDGEATDGDAAIQLALSREWDIVLLDISLPKKNGIRVLEEIVARKPNLPVVMLSSHAEEEFGEFVYAKGAACYVEKANTDRLVECMRYLLMPNAQCTRSHA